MDDKDLDDDFDDFLDDSFDDDFSDDDGFDSEDTTNTNTFDEDMDLDADDELDSDFDLDEFDELQDDDEWSEDGEGNVDESLVASNKKNFLSGLSFNTMVIIGAVVVGLIVMVVQISSKKPKPTEERFVSAIRHQGASSNDPQFDEGSETTEQTQLPAQETDPFASQESFLLNPDLLDTVETNLPQNDTDEMTEEPATAQNDILTPMPDNRNNPIVEKQVPRYPDADDEEIVLIPEENTMTANEFPNSLNIMSIEETDTPSLLDTNATDPSMEIIAAEEEPAEKTTEQLIREGIQEKDNLIIETMNNSEPTIKKMEKTVPEPIAEPVAEEPVVTEVIEEQKPEPVAEPVMEEDISIEIDTPQIKEEPPVVAYNKPQTKKKVVRSSRTAWDLRAVQPGKAWVSRKGTRNIQPVVIGDTLEGIGRITEISQRNGRWYVQGTKGQIRQ